MSFNSEDLVTGVVTFVGLVVIFLVISLLLTWPLMLLINWLFAPSFLLSVFGVSHITFWQTYALSVVCGYLFKSTSTSSK